MLTVHLHKEWREQRLLVGCGVIAMLVLGAGVPLFAPAAMVPADIAELFAMLGLAIAFVVVTSDLIPGETRRRQLDWLRRLPDGLARALLAKGLTTLAVFAILAITGFAVGHLCSTLVGQPGVDVRQPALAPLKHPAAWLAAVLAILTPWAMALSCWLPRGGAAIVLTVCGGALVMAWPVWVALAFRPPVTVAVLVAVAICVFCAGVLALQQSFRLGLDPARRRRGARGAALALVLGVAPAQIWAGERLHAFHHVDLAADRVKIREVLLDADGTAAWCQIARPDWQRHGVHHVVRVDLADREWTQVGGAQAFLEHAGPLVSEFARQPWLHLLTTDRRGATVVDRRRLDTRDGRDLDPAEPAVTAPLRLPDGARVFQLDDVLVRESADGERCELAIPAGVGIGWGNGFGRRWFERGATPEHRILDLDRLAVFEDPSGRVFVRPGWWIVEHPTRGLELLDPADGRRRPFDPGAGVEVRLVLADGRVLCAHRDEAEPWILDIESGRRTTLRIPRSWPRGWRFGPVWSLRATAGASTPSGATIVEVRNRYAGPRSFYGLARIAPDGTVVSTPLRDSPLRLAAVLDDDRVLVVGDDSRELAVLSFAGDPPRTVLRCGPRR